MPDSDQSNLGSSSISAVPSAAAVSSVLILLNQASARQAANEDRSRDPSLSAVPSAAAVSSRVPSAQPQKVEPVRKSFVRRFEQRTAEAKSSTDCQWKQETRRKNWKPKKSARACPLPIQLHVEAVEQFVRLKASLDESSLLTWPEVTHAVRAVRAASWPICR